MTKEQFENSPLGKSMLQEMMMEEAIASAELAGAKLEDVDQYDE